MDDDRFPLIEVRSAAELRAWLTEHHTRTESVWLVTYRKAVPRHYVDHETVMDALIAFGWIDGIRRQIDAERTRQLISPRRTQPWARSYKVRAERLIAEGAMQPAGLESVEKAKSTGMWEVMNEVDDLVVPDDLSATLRLHPPADAHFAAFPPSTRRNILRWIAGEDSADPRETHRRHCRGGAAERTGEEQRVGGPRRAHIASSDATCGLARAATVA